MAIFFVCGHECRDLGASAAITPDELHWDGAGVNVSISTTTVRTGTSSLRSNPTAAAGQLNKALPAGIRTLAGRIYLRAASLPAATEKPIILNGDNASGNFRIRLQSDGQVTVNVGTSGEIAVGSPISTGTWYRIDWLMNSSGATASLKATVDGGTEAEATNAQAAADITVYREGVFTTATCDLFFDDTILGDASANYPFGAGTVERMKPTRDGTHSFTAGDFAYDTAGGNVATSATDVWTYVDDDNLTSTADLIRQAVIRSTGYVEVGFGSAPNSWDALAVNVVSSWHASATGADTAGMKLNDGGTLKNITDEAGDGLSDVSQTTIMVIEKVLTTAPSSGAWTASKLGAVLIRAGYSTDVIGIPYWDGVMLEVAYGPQPAAAANPPYTNPMPPLIAQ